MEKEMVMVIKNAYNNVSNGRVRIASGYHIEFLSNAQYKVGTYFETRILNLYYDFECVGSEIEGDYINVYAKAVTKKLEKDNIDLRAIVGNEVTEITDKDLIFKINVQKTYC